MLGVLAALAAGGCAAVPLPARAIQLNRDGAAALALGDLETAEARIALALEYSARFTEAWVNLGLVELRRGNFERALRDFVRARNLNPDLPAPHHALGLLADRRGEGARAEAYYRAALRVDPGFAPARVDLGRKLYERGALEDAREQFLRAVEVAPDVPEAWSGLCATLLRLDRVDEAAMHLARAVAKVGRTPLLALLEARVALVRGRYGEAEEDLLRSALVDAGGDPGVEAEALAWLAIARLAEGRAPAACAAASRAVAVDAHDGVAQFAFRACQSQPGDGAGR
ncbi:MAG: tetratricopeptide repeat protein [Polyangiaceae bacterium]|nr:tetratricopeptide repeat protein [Polyangiaceae bacterium]